MTRQIFRSLFAMGLVAVFLITAWTQAAFTDTVLIENNTFVTGDAELKLYYDCYTDPTGTPAAQATRTYTTGVLPVGDTGAYVECPANDNLLAAGTLQSQGEWEHAALTYSDITDNLGVGSVDDGATVASTEVFNYEGAGGAVGDWTTANGWYDGLSSPQDWTNIYPGWATHSAGPDAIQTGPTAILAGEGDILSVGNAGTVPLSEIEVVAMLEGSGTDEGFEPLDGLLDTPVTDGIGDTFIGGGDRIDPLSDAGWVTAGKTYDTGLADVIYVQIERLDATGTPTVVYSGTLDALVTAGATGLMGAETLDPDEVVYFRFNWEMDTAADNTYENLLFDYRMDFTGTT